MNYEISASILGACELNLAGNITKVAAHGIKRLHIDIMDGHYVDNISFGSSILSKLCQHFPEMQLDVHLMVTCVENLVRQCLALGADSICFHPKVATNPKQTIELIQAHGVSAGIVINPTDNIKDFAGLYNVIDEIIFMTVTPGACGQDFMAERLNTLMELQEFYNGKITLDGGVKPEILPLLAPYTIQRLVVGSGLFSGNIADNIAKFANH